MKKRVRNYILRRMARREFLSAASMATAGLMMSSVKANAEGCANGIRFGSNPDGVRMVVDLSENSAYNIFLLSNPSRVVLDLTDVTCNKATIEKDATGHVSDVRLGSGATGGGSRIVVDISSPLKVKKAFSLSPSGKFNWRLVVDLEKTSEADFAQLVGIGHAVSSMKDVNAVPKSQITTKPKEIEAAPVVATPPRKKKIILDPGHGGRDPGAIGYSGVYEKNITLAMGQELKKICERTGKYDVHLTRNSDHIVSLRGRVKKARELEGDLFISLHADSTKNKKVMGLSVYTLSENASDKEAGALADRENKADIIAGIDLGGETPEVAGILIDLAQRETMNRSAHFASLMVGEVQKAVRILKNTHRFAGFAVLKAPDIPSVLLEMGYLSNKTEEKLLRERSYRRKLANAVLTSIDDYFSAEQKASLF